MKSCTKCNETKPMSDFRDGKNVCKVCTRHAANIYRAAHKDKVDAVNEAYRIAHKDKINAATKAWNASNPGKATASKKAWRDSNRTEHRARAATRRARRRNAEGVHTSEDISRLMVLQKGKCACCKAGINKSHHVDHIQPLASGGSNWPSNIQLLCPTCNLQKSAKHPVDFMQQKGFLL